MSEAKLDGIFNLTLPVVLAFPNLLEAKPFMKNGKPQGDPKYSANLIIAADHPDLKPMKELVTSLARQRWPDKPFSELAFPFTSGDKLAEARKAKGKDDGDYQRGKVVMNAKSKYEPRLSVLINGKLVDLDTDILKALHKNKFYNGVEVLAQINFVPYDPIGQNAKGGVTAYLNIVVSTGKGKRLSGGAPASEVFKGYVGGVSAEDPTNGDNLDNVIGI